MHDKGTSSRPGDERGNVGKSWGGAGRCVTAPEVKTYVYIYITKVQKPNKLWTVMVMAGGINATAARSGRADPKRNGGGEGRPVTRAAAGGKGDSFSESARRGRELGRSRFGFEE